MKLGKFYPMSENIPPHPVHGRYRSASFHDIMFDLDLLSCKGGWEAIEGLGWGASDAEVPENGTWWAQYPLAFDPILTHQQVPHDAQMVFRAMIGACFFKVGEQIPHPDSPTDFSRHMKNSLQVLLFIWGRAGTGKSTLLKMLFAAFSKSREIVGVLENEGCDKFGLAKVRHSYLVLGPDVDSRFSVPATQLAAMVSGERLFTVIILPSVHLSIQKALMNACEADRGTLCKNGLIPNLDAAVAAPANTTECLQNLHGRLAREGLDLHPHRHLLSSPFKRGHSGAECTMPRFEHAAV